MSATRGWMVVLAGMVAALLAWTVAVPAQNSKPKRIVWKGVETFENAYTYGGRNSGTLGLANDYHHRTIISFSRVEEVDAQGNSHVVSHKIAWSAEGQSVANGYETTTCDGAGSIELVGMSADASREKMKIPCKTRTESNFFGFFPKPPDRILVPKVVQWEDLRESCSYAEEQTAPNGEHHTYSAWVAAELDAVMDVKTDRSSLYWAFVPEPGGSVSFAVRSNVPARFRFKLEDVSALYGFAGNAAVDDAFFTAYPKIQNLRGSYDSRGPDLIFNPEDFRQGHWQAPSPDLQSVETDQDDASASITVTAMDYAASGKLRVEAKDKCGDWQPVRVRVNGEERKTLAIPLDENDNLIADRMEQPDNGITSWAYAGALDGDTDPLPKGDGTPGDGLTLFEEYRGFMSAAPADANSCKDRKYDTHVRTDPTQKDLFIITEDLELAEVAPMLEQVTRLEGTSKGVAVHLGCDVHHRRRTINFTLSDPQFGPKEWKGKTLSFGRQHGLLMHDARLEGVLGSSRGNAGIGPPKNICGAPPDPDISIDKVKILEVASKRVNGSYAAILASIAMHELGHGIGIDHNGDNDIDIAFLITSADCPPESFSVDELGLAVVFDPPPPTGAHACLIWSVARRHGQHSGDAFSPMKYTGAAFYESPADPLKRSGEGSYKVSISSPPESLEAYTGTVYKYRADLDREGLGPFPDNNRGTGINALPGEQNHAGDSCRIAATQIHITDFGPDPVQLIPCPADSPRLERADICKD